MKIKIVNFGRDCWQTLTEVPGWPDAPRAVRVRRVLPLVIPCVAMLLLLGWNRGVRDPQRAKEEAAYQALLAQEKEVDMLRLTCSEKQAADLALHADQVARLVLNDPHEIGAVLQGLKREAAERHWEGIFQAADLSTGAPSPATQLTFLPARAKLTSTTGNSEAFSSLLALFERFSAAEKRIDLTRMEIRADEQGRYTVELNLRLIGRSPHEKITQ